MSFLPATLLILVFLVAVPEYGLAKASGDQAKTAKTPNITGFWYTEQNEAGVELYSCGHQICGRFRWIAPKKNGELHRDINNPDASKRDRPLCHMQFMGGFTPSSAGKYDNGWIYSPEHGATFDAEINVLAHNKIELHGYLLVPAFGDSQTWTRSVSMPDCEKAPNRQSGDKNKRRQKAKPPASESVSEHPEVKP